MAGSSAGSLALKEISKEDVKKLLSKLVKKAEVYAPVVSGEAPVTIFKNISVSENDSANDIDSISLAGLSYNPAKTVFFKKTEALFGFDNNKLSYSCKPVKQKILFGLKKCDLNSISRQDIVFSEAKDCWYMMKRQNSLLIGHHCSDEIDTYCFCNSMELKSMYDVMLYDVKGGYLAEPGSAAGAKFMNEHKAYFKKSSRKLTNAMKTTKSARLLNTTNLDKKLVSAYNVEDWKHLSEPCLSCGACNILCPSCYCFDIHDEVELCNLKKGRRLRTHSSCQLFSFTEIRGKAERSSREERLKHRVYHQLKFFKDKHGIALCTGCGRCIRHCPVRINFIGVLNKIKC